MEEPCRVCGRAANDTAAPQRTRSPLRNPRLALAAVAILLVAVTIGVTLIRADDRPDAQGSTAAPAANAPGSTAAPSINGCLLGSWTVERATTRVFVEDDIVDFTTVNGVIWQFNADGSGRYDFGRSTTYVGSHEGDQITYVYDGEVTFTYSTESGQLKLDNRRHRNAVHVPTVSVRGKRVEASVLSMAADSLTYKCSGDSLSIIDEIQEIYLHRP
jgi:hypothetical protein